MHAFVTRRTVRLCVYEVQEHTSTPILMCVNISDQCSPVWAIVGLSLSVCVCYSLTTTSPTWAECWDCGWASPSSQCSNSWRSL